MYRFFRVDHYFYSKAAEQVYSFGFDWCFSYLGKKVIRLTRHNQAVDFFFFSEAYTEGTNAKEI